MYLEARIVRTRWTRWRAVRAWGNRMEAELRGILEVDASEFSVKAFGIPDPRSEDGLGDC
jgi:hypothetical protein